MNGRVSSPRNLRIGSLNVRGCGTDEMKREVIGRMFVRRKLDVLAVNETKMKGRGEREFGSVQGRVSGVTNGRGREGVGLLLSEEMKKNVKEWCEVSSRLMWVRVQLGIEKWVFVSAYGPGSEKSEEEREMFWERLNECLSMFRENVRVVVLGDLNARVGDEPVVDVIGRYGVPGRNESGEKLIGLCLEREMMIGNTWFMKKDINKYTWERVVRGRVEDKALMDYVLVSKSVRNRLSDVHVYRGAANGVSDHYLVEGRVRIVGRWRQARGMVEGRKAVKVNELRKKEKELVYREIIGNRWEGVEVMESRGIEEEWADLKAGLLEGGGEVCGFRKVGCGMRKGSEWWNDRVKKAVEEKKKAYEEWMQKKGRRLWEVYKEKRNECRRIVRREKRGAKWRWGKKLHETFVRDRRMFWKEAGKARKGEKRMEECVKDMNGQLIVESGKVRERWKEYFDGLLNVEDGREAEVLAIGGRGDMPLLQQLNDRPIGRGEIESAVKELSVGKAPGMDGIAPELVKYGGEALMLWLERVLGACFEESVVPRDFRDMCMVPCYKGKGDKHECNSYRGICLMSVVGKVYGRVLINRVRKGTEVAIGEEQGGFRKGRGCVDQIFVVRQMCEKFSAKGKEVYVAFMDLEKAYDRVDRRALWQVVGLYGVGGKLLRALKSMYEDNRMCVRVGGKESEWFESKVGLRQGCVMSPWLFNLYMDGVVREVSARVEGKGAKMMSAGGREWELCQVLFADDTALVADSEEKLQKLVDEFGRVCERRKLKVNVNKSKVMRCTGREDLRRLNVSLNGEVLEEVNQFKYLGAQIGRKGGVEEDVCWRVGEARKAAGTLKKLWKNGGLGMGGKKMLYEGIVVPTALYGAETWGLREAERRKLNVFEMGCLRSMCGVTLWDRVRNEEVRRRVHVERQLSDRVDQSVLRWFGHVERMDEERLVKRVMNADVEGNRPRGRPKFGWMDGVRKALGGRGMTVEQGRQNARDRRGWEAIVRR